MEYTPDEKEEWTEYDVVCGYMMGAEETVEKHSSFTLKKDAKNEYDRIVRDEDYDYVDLVERTMEGEDCMCSDNIKEWKK